MSSEKRTPKGPRGEPARALPEQESKQNRLLSSLPPAALNALLRDAEFITLRSDQVLYAAGAPLAHAYFPLTGMISLSMQGGNRPVEVAIVGPEGMFGMALFFESAQSPMTAICQSEGRAARVRAAHFMDRARRDQHLSSALKRYAQAFTTMLGQSALCNAAHRIEKRYARWLLTAQDRLCTDEFTLTQGRLAEMLAVRRPTVSEIASHLQRRKLIRYSQGRMAILDRPGLESVACECHNIIRSEYERMGLI